MRLNKTASFRAYIDESGDEGFRFRADGSGSSRWFVISALVLRLKNDAQVVECLKETRKLLAKPFKYPLHFVDLKHEQRVPYARRVGNLAARTVSVLIYKPSIQEPEKFQNEKYLLYRYATRLLLERVSWLCRDHRIDGEGDGSCDIIFSNRSNMSYEQIQSYLRHLIDQSGPLPQDVQIEPTAIRPEQIKAVEHSKLAGLQAADAVASSMHFAVKRNRYGESEPAYSRLLTKTFYRHKGSLQGYGIKLWPDTLAELKTKAPEAKHLEGL
ncbi:MAG: DUF3800 domain-containing protein [Verrucomicrobia bacterium]|jgi:hypothetical protein|nr:DUF3800 domain-containing protein [Verrucomicrobiota bacterium]